MNQDLYNEDGLIIIFAVILLAPYLLTQAGPYALGASAWAVEHHVLAPASASLFPLNELAGIAGFQLVMGSVLLVLLGLLLWRKARRRQAQRSALVEARSAR